MKLKLSTLLLVLYATIFLTWGFCTIPPSYAQDWDYTKTIDYTYAQDDKTKTQWTTGLTNVTEWYAEISFTGITWNGTTSSPTISVSILNSTSTGADYVAIKCYVETIQPCYTWESGYEWATDPQTCAIADNVVISETKDATAYWQVGTTTDADAYLPKFYLSHGDISPFAVMLSSQLNDSVTAGSVTFRIGTQTTAPISDMSNIIGQWMPTIISMAMLGMVISMLNKFGKV